MPYEYQETISLIAIKSFNQNHFKENSALQTRNEEF